MSNWKDSNLNLSEAYDYVEFTLTDGQTNYDCKTNQASLFHNIPYAGIVVIETSVNISVKFNATTMPAVKLDAGASPMELVRKLNIKNIFLTNSSGSSSTIRIWLFV